jgi:hypothetical protein
MLRIRRRLLAWALLAIALPLLAESLHLAANTIEARRGASPASRRLHQAGRAADRLRDLRR